MSKAVKRQNRKIRSFREHMVKLVTPFAAFPISVFWIKCVTTSTELAEVRSWAALHRSISLPTHIRAVGRCAHSWLVLSMLCTMGMSPEAARWWKDLEEAKDGRCHSKAGQISPGRIFLIPAACISCHHIPSLLCFGLHHWITPRQTTYRSQIPPFFIHICITENVPTGQDLEAEETPSPRSVTVDSRFYSVNISCFLVLVCVLYAVFRLSRFWERCPGMVTGFPPGEYHGILPVLFRYNLDFFLTRSSCGSLCRFMHSTGHSKSGILVHL